MNYKDCSEKEFLLIHDKALSKLTEECINTLKGLMESAPNLTQASLAPKLTCERSIISRRLGYILMAFGFEESSLSTVRKEQFNQLCTLYALYRLSGYSVHLKRIEYLRQEGYLKPIHEDLSRYVPLTSRYYTERPPLEEDSFSLIEYRRTIQIVGCRESGKTSLLKRMIFHANTKLGYSFVDINFRKLGHSEKSNLSKLLYWFCQQIHSQTNITGINAPKRANSLSISECSNYIKKVAENSLRCIIFALDNMDTLYEFDLVYIDFMSMLRVWHEETGMDETSPWEKLRIVYTRTTDYSGKLPTNRSLDNVAESVPPLRNFTKDEIRKLVARYGFSIAPIDPKISELMEFISGIPCLTRLALHSIATSEFSATEILNQAASPQGIFSKHLLRILRDLRKHPLLEEKMLEAINSSEPINLDPEIARQLQNRGYIKHVKYKSYTLICELYRHYLREYLDKI